MIYPEFTLYTDGSCPKPNGPGGWASICLEDSWFTRLHGAVETTNNRMEMMAVIGGLRPIPNLSVVTVYSDSEYVIKGYTLWLPKWRDAGWPSRIKNLDLWHQMIDQVVRMKEVTFRHVKGHAGDHWNEVADRLAGEQTKLFARMERKET